MNIELMLYKCCMNVAEILIENNGVCQGGGQRFRIPKLHLDSYIYSVIFCDWIKWGWMMHGFRMNVVLMQYECRMNVAEMLIENYWVCQGGGGSVLEYKITSWFLNIL